MKNLLVLIAIAFSWCLPKAFAAPFTFNVDGVITDSSNNPLEAASVTFQIDVKDSSETCILYRETFLVDMTGSNGYFSIPLGKQTNAIAGGSTLEKVFSNQDAPIPGDSCSYTPSSSAETRKIVISFNDGVTTQIFATQEIQSVPFALEAVQASKVGDYAATNLLKVATSVNTNTNTPLNQTQYDEFWRLITNPLAAYLPTTGDVTVVSGNNRVTTFLGQALPAGPATNGQVLVSNGTTWTLQTMSAGSVTSVSGTAPIASSGGATPTISISQAGTATDGYLSSTDWNAFNSKLSGALADGKMWVGNSGVASEVNMSGDATLSNAGALTLASTITAGSNKGAANKVAQITYDAKGRLTAVAEVTIDDNTKLPLAGGTMSGAINMGAFDFTNAGNISMAANKYFSLSANATNGTVAGQMWYDAGTIKYFDGSTVRSLGVAGAGITNLNGITSGTQSFAIGTSGNAPTFSSVTDTHTLNIPMASSAGTVTAGLLSNAEYAALNAKQSNTLAAAQVWVGNASGGAEARALSGDISIDNAGATSLAAIKGKAVDSTAATTMGQILFFDSVADKWKVSASTAPTDGQVMKWNDTTKTWEPGTDAGGWTAVNASTSTKGIMSVGSGLTDNGNGLVSVNYTTMGVSNKVLALDGSGVAYMYGAGINGATAGSVMLQVPGSVTSYSLTLPAAGPPAGDQILVSDSSGNLSWGSNVPSINNSAALSSGKLWVGNASGVASEVSMSGDATMDNTGALTLDSTITAGSNKGDANKVAQITYDAKGRLTAVAEVTIDDNTKLPLAGGTMSGAINMGAFDFTNTGNISMAANKYFSLSANATDGSVPGQMWYDAGTIKYFDGSNVKSLGVAGAGITNLNGLSSLTQTFAVGSAGLAPAITSSGSTHTLDIPLASGAAVTAGVISKTDYDSFSAKQSNALAATQVWVGNASGGAEARALSGDATVDNTGVVTVDKTQSAAASKILQLNANSVAVTKGLDVNGSASGSVSIRGQAAAGTYTLTLPNSAGSANQVLQTDGSGALSWTSVLSGVSDIASLANGKFWLGNTSGKAVEVSMSGDATMDNTGALTLDSTITAGSNKGDANKVAQITYDAKGRLTAVTEVAIDDNTKLPLAGGTMSGAINMGGFDFTNTGNISMAANKYFSLSANATDGTIAGQMWYDGGVIKYHDGTTVKSLGVAGAGITSLNGLSSLTQTFAVGSAGLAPAITSSGSTHTLDIPLASGAAVTAGVISKTDYDSFSAKQSNALAATQVWVGNASGGAEARALSGDATVDNTGVVTVDKTQSAAASKILQLNANSVAVTKGLDVNGSASGSVSIRGQAAAGTYTLTLPNSAGSANQVLQTDGTGALSWTSVLSGVSDIASLANGKFWLGNTSGKAVEVSMSGDATMNNTGVLTLSTSVTGNINSKLPLAGGTMSGAILAPITTSSAPSYSLGATDTGLFSPIAGDVGIATSGVERLRVDSSGKVGIGTNSPSSILDINGAETMRGTSSPGISSSGQGRIYFDSTSNKYKVSQNGSAYADLVGPGALASTNIWVGNASGVAQARTISGDATIDNTGSLTLNSTITSNINSKLPMTGGTMTGSLTSSSQIAPGFSVNSATTGTLSLNFNNGNTITTTHDCGTMINLQNMVDGGNYTVVVTSASTTACSFSASGVTQFKFSPANGARTASTHTVYSMLKAGSFVYVWWTTGL